MKNLVKKISLKKTLGKHKGKGGLETSPYKQADAPIDLLSFKGEPPTASSIPNTKDNMVGNRVTK